LAKLGGKDQAEDRHQRLIKENQQKREWQ
jgi:hypothetical protein